MEASITGSDALVTMLFPHEAGLTDAKGRTALMMAVSSRKPTIVNLIVDLDESASRLREIGVADQFGMTALMYASAIGGDELIGPFKRLAAHEAYKKDLQGRTALDYARSKEKDSFVTILEEIP